MTDTQKFKIVLPILKTRTEIVKDDSGDEKEVRYIEGVASSTDKDLHGDRMAPSAIESMAKSLKYHIINLNAEHDTSWRSEIGDITRLEVSDDQELMLEAQLNDMSNAKDLWYALTEQDKKLGLSIGGYVKEYEMEKEEDEEGNASWVRVYKDIELDHVAVTSRPANPKTWVSVISKSIDPKRDKELIKALEKSTEKKYNTKSIKELARKIARKVQDIEASLLLELTESILFRLESSQIEKIEEYLNTLERNMSMDDKKKDVSLEADEAKKANPNAEPDDVKDEESAALENESSDKASKADDGAEPTTPKPEGEPAKPAEGEGEAPEGGEAEPAAKPEEDADDSGEESASEDSEDSESEESADKGDSAEKSESGSLAELVAGLTDTIKKVVTSNEELIVSNEALLKRVEELEGQPAERKTVEVSKGLGDDDSEEVDAKDLRKEMDEKIAEARKDFASDPTLFSRIQKIRADYAIKARGI